MKNTDRWGSYPIVGSGKPEVRGPLEALLKVSLRDSGEETGVIHKRAEDRYIAFAYERSADGRRVGLQPVKECSSFSDAANALRLNHQNRTGARNRYVPS